MSEFLDRVANISVKGLYHKLQYLGKTSDIAGRKLSEEYRCLECGTDIRLYYGTRNSILASISGRNIGLSPKDDMCPKFKALL